jgi:peroxiredoxin
MPRKSFLRRWCLPAGTLSCLLLLTAGCEPPPVEGQRVGDQAPEIAGRDPDGNLLRLGDYKGKVVLVNFWGTWCPPCRALLPHERHMVEAKYKGRPFVLLGVAKDSADTLKEFQKDNPLPWPNIADESGMISQMWGVRGFPAAILVDHHGVIRGSWREGIDPTEVWAEVDKLVQAAEAP